MPTFARIGPYRFYVYSHEPNEPPHIHADRDEKSAKFWLDPVSLAKNFGFRASELTIIRNIIVANRKPFLDEWHEFFSNRRR